MDERSVGSEPERALARALRARTALRRLPAPPAALRDIAWSRAFGNARTDGAGPKGIGRRAGAAADAACAAALAACLACSVAFGRVDTELARRLDDPAIAAGARAMLSPATLAALGLSLSDRKE